MNRGAQRSNTPSDWGKAVACSAIILLMLSLLLLFYPWNSGKIGIEGDGEIASSGPGGDGGGLISTGNGTGAESSSGSGGNVVESTNTGKGAAVVENSAERAGEAVKEQASPREPTAEKGETESTTDEEVEKILKSGPPAVGEIAMIRPSLASPTEQPQESSAGGFGGGAMAKPKNAITKGSFSVWTVPANPNPGQSYVIHIQVTLPKNVTVYDMSDLNGTVRGTDNYMQDIHYPTGQRINVMNNIIQVTVGIPGAKKLVRDTIIVRSNLLDESQTMEIVF